MESEPAFYCAASIHVSNRDELVTPVACRMRYCAFLSSWKCDHCESSDDGANRTVVRTFRLISISAGLLSLLNELNLLANRFVLILALLQQTFDCLHSLLGHSIWCGYYDCFLYVN